jgi:ATP-dependent exoDNAse (exonuclease V) beta subunit
VATAQGRTLGATDEEVESAAKVVRTVLAQPILQRAREAMKTSRCRREAPVAWCDGERLVEGVIDLAFEDQDRWTLVDFKTDEEIGESTTYERQVGLYAASVEAACAAPVSAFLLRI